MGLFDIILTGIFGNKYNTDKNSRRELTNLELAHLFIKSPLEIDNIIVPDFSIYNRDFDSRMTNLFHDLIESVYVKSYSNTYPDYVISYKG